LALRWSDVNIDRGRLVVRQQLVQIAGHHAGPYCGQAHREMLFGSPKTASGDARIVELDGQTTGLLLEHRLRQDTERAQWGDAYADHGLVFAHEDGTPLYGDEVTKRFGELCDAAGVRRVRLHDLRHGRASLLLAAGADIAVVSKILGHGSINITSDTYAHLLEGVGKAATEAASALVPRSHRDSPPTGGHTSGTPGAPEEIDDQGIARSEGGPPGTRTRNLRIKSPQLCH
jgi:integrase